MMEMYIMIMDLTLVYSVPCKQMHIVFIEIII